MADAPHTRSRQVGPLPGTALHYRDTGSPLHRLGAGWKLAILVSAAALAISAGGAASLGLLLLLVLAGYRAAHLSGAELWQDARWLAAQALFILLLSVARDGAEGIARGGLVALRIALFFLPVALALRTTPSRDWLQAARRVLSPELAFGVASSLRFAPYFARELSEIVGAQRLRGARLSARQLWHPAAWRDWIGCVGVPLAVRVIHTANEAALAARIRGLGSDEGEAP